MDNKLILDQIINNSNQIISVDSIKIINNLFSKLNRRECNILTRRFGLRDNNKETLDKIGKAYRLTRERIRQIEINSIKKIKQLEKFELYINDLKRIINLLIEEYGGLIECEYLFDNLIHFSSEDVKQKAKNKKIQKNCFNFLLTKLLHDDFEKIDNSKNFKNYFKLKSQELGHLENLAEELLEKIKQEKNILKTHELINLIRDFKSFQSNRDRFNTKNNIDISNILRNENFQEDTDLINNNKVIYSILQVLSEIKQNRFGYWGYYNWSEINPRTINDKIYLILKNRKKPMHFIEIADEINKIGFDKKNAHPATVHNELILDDKYILVGRGLYSLKELGYKKGTVSDVVEYILSKANSPLNQEKIVEKVLKQRMVRTTTIILALMDKNKFQKIGKKYTIKNKISA